MGFAERLQQHDTQALPLVREIFARYGYVLYPFGIELVPELQKTLTLLSDPLSKMLRYRPDQVAIRPGKESLLLEIKSENKRSPNFAVEYDAWEAAKFWNLHMRNLLYVFVDLAENKVYACWPETLQPRKVFVPRLEDRKRFAEAGIEIVYLSVVSGSGTAFFLVAKQQLLSLEKILLERSCEMFSFFLLFKAV